jgi:copper resistance protein B
MIRRTPALLWSLAALVGFSMAQAQEAPAGHEHHHPAPEAPQPAPAENESNRDQDSSEARHVPPDPPARAMGPMSYEQMAAMMQMDDRERLGKVILDQAEWRDTREGNALVWDAEGWYGGDYNKLWIRTEGERTQGRTQDGQADVLWDRIFARWWSVQAGAREDFGAGPPRTWAAVGVEGLAPYWFNIEATLYAGEQGRTAARVRAEYELLFTQRLILQPEIELNLYGKTDPEREIGAGLADLDVGLRLRYEIRREFAPYVGIAWRQMFGRTADFARAAGGQRSEAQVVAGVRVWF